MQTDSHSFRPVTCGRKLIYAFIPVVCGLGLTVSPAHGGVDRDGRTWSPGRMFVKLRVAADGQPGKASPELRQILGSGLETARPLSPKRGPLPAGLDRLVEVGLPETTDIPALAAKVSRLSEVEYAEPVWEYSLAATTGRDAPAATPNDPAYTGGQQAYLANMQVAAAWDVQKSIDATPRPIVCIVDGGTNWLHEDLNANMWTNPGEIPANSIDDDGNGFVDDIHGWDFRDNNGDPRGSPSTPSNANHGTHTGGLAAMVTDNGIGGAATSWNPYLMGVNASSNGDQSIAYGYQGIVYAADNGADVVSLSWGGGGGGQAEQDIIDYATAQGTLVMAAAGNGNTNKRFYPAAYRNVIAVANVTVAEVRYSGPSGSNYGGWLDVAACGTSVYSTFDMNSTNAYGLSTGTSMACPVAASVATLIAARHPTWGPLKVGEQLRVTCDNINAQNPSFVDQLGKGRVNALRAMTEFGPGVRATSWTFTDTDSDGQLEQGESVVMSLNVHNYLAPAVSPSYAISTTSPWITITDAAQAGATLMEDADATLANAFAFTVNPNVPPGTALDLRLDITAMGYVDFQYVPVFLEPLFETHDVNSLEVSLTATGGVGWVGFPSEGDGEGFVFQGGSNVLFEGALLLGTGPAKLSDAARIGGEHTDFAPILHAPPFKLTPGPSGEQEIHAAFTDSINTATPLGVRVDLQSWASGAAGDEDFVIAAYEIRNRSASPTDSLWAALWFDWDIDESHYTTNRTAYDASRKLGYAWDATPGLPYTGVLALSGVESGFSAIANGGPGGPVILVDGFSKAEKWDVLQGGTGVLSAGPTDISNAMSSGPYRLPVGGRALVVFALVAGTNLADLQSNADRARQFWIDDVLTDAGQPPGARGPAVALGPATPNPFNPSTRFTLEVREDRDVRVGIYDVRGREVTTLVAGQHSPGRYTLDWNGTDLAGRKAASGVYFARLRSGNVVQMRRLVLAK